MRSAFTFILRRELYHPRRMWKWYRVYPIEIIGCYCFLHKSPLLHTYSDIVDVRTSVRWPCHRVVGSHNPRCVLEGSAAPRFLRRSNTVKFLE